MIRRCDGTDPFLVGKDDDPCGCGAVFDDVEWEVGYPHRRLTGTETLRLPRRLGY